MSAPAHGSLSARLFAFDLSTRLRAIVRSSELSLVVVAVVVGVLAGLGVAAMTELVDIAHVVIYGIPFDVRLSAAARVSPVAAFAALPLGGLAVGLIDHWRRAPQAAARGRPH